MLKRFDSNLSRILASILIFSQCCLCALQAQNNERIKVSLLKQNVMSSMGIAQGNYSGITHIKNDTFAIISDKAAIDGGIIKYIKISQSPETGRIISIKDITPVSFNTHSSLLKDDCEDIAYNEHTNTVFICSESKQSIKEYTLQAHPTGRKLDIPSLFAMSNITLNKGFEAIAYDANKKEYWTITEANLKSDANNETMQMTLRLQSFDSTLVSRSQYIYQTDTPKYSGKYKEYAFGVPAILSLGNGTLFVMEREMCIKNEFLGSFSETKIFIVRPETDNEKLSKTKVCSFSTHLNLTKMNIANYEGMCLGTKLCDGRQTVILISDSQNGAGNCIYSLKDYLKVLIIGEKEQ
jgi:hypothetical protein